MLRSLEERGLISRVSGIDGDARPILVTIRAQNTDLLTQAKQAEAAPTASEAQPFDGTRADLLEVLQARLPDR